MQRAILFEEYRRPAAGAAKCRFSASSIKHVEKKKEKMKKRFLVSVQSRRRATPFMSVH